MGQINWLDKIGWTEENLEDIRYTGFSYVKQGKYEIALNFFEALAILVPNEPYDAQTLGAIYLQLNEPKKALKQFEKALQLAPKHAPTLLNLSKTFFSLGRKEEALKICHLLKKNENLATASVAKALILAYS